ncbi:MAG: hydantoinase/oxoprolinase family protein [Gammaproteobacteria bacterium]|nr:hydantoinase/oxoprolinase family protein [Gammaproteobacteria bacterium]
MTQQPLRLAIDIGGTFTDLALALTDGIVTAKRLTTPAAPEQGVLDGIRTLLSEHRISPGDVSMVIHGTTLATNALIERKGAKTALLTTAGLRDSLEMAQENRFAQYDIGANRPRPLVPRYLRWPVTERLNWRGEVLTPLDETSVHRIIAQLVAHGIESLAIGFIHAYANPAHEQQAAAIIAAELPELSLSLSSEVCPEVREYERQSTTVANAYVRPVMAGYLARLRAGLDELGCAGELLLMSSAGTLMGLDAAKRYPIRLVESGPAGGAILAAQIAAEEGYERVVSYDMGGTTAKICLLDSATPLTSRSLEVARAYRFMRGSGLPVRIPVIEMVEIGAGGGSIASVDALGRIGVGPRSAGSEPGPACYGRGGLHATVTDADLALGKLDPQRFAGGSFTLDTAAATEAVREHVAAPLGVEHTEAAFGIAEVVDENMAAAARMHAVERGTNLARRVMIAFGGAAPLHAARLAQKLAIGTVVIPRGAGVGSAIGFLRAPIAYEVVRSRYARLTELNSARMDTIFRQMYGEARDLISAAAPNTPLTQRRSAYMRYVGQGHEIQVTVDSSLNSSELRESFEQAYRQLFGRIIPGLEIEVLSWTLRLSTAPLPVRWPPMKTPPRQTPGATTDAPPVAVTGARMLFDADTAGWLETPVYARQSITTATVVTGPALIEEDETTTVVPPAFSATSSTCGHLIISNTSTADTTS